MTKKVEDMEQRLKKYAWEISHYLVEKTNEDLKVQLSAFALSILYVHTDMGLVLTSMCPEDYLIQLKVLREQMNYVVSSIDSNNFTSETWLANIMRLSVRLKHFMEFIGHCYGLNLDMEIAIPFAVPDGTSYLELDLDLPEPQPSLSVDKPLGEQSMEVLEALRGYIDKLINFIYRKSGQDWHVPLALLVLHLIELHRIMMVVLDDMCPDLLQAHGKALETILGEVIEFFRDKAKPGKDEASRLPNMIAYRFKDFLEFLAQCLGEDLELKVETAEGGAPYISVVRYGPLPPQGSQGAPEG
jgi:hypothetical protein